MKQVSNPEFWNQRYLDNNTKWDIGAPTPILSDYLAHNNPDGEVCILGCGNGYDAIEFSKHGNRVYAVDFSEEALKNLKAQSKSENLSLKLVNNDIFNLSDIYPKCFDMVYEYTCFCAIDPNRRMEYFNMVYSILKPDGLFFAIFIPLDKEIDDDGPPFGVNINQILDIIGNRFTVIENCFSDLSIEPRFNREKLVILKKK